jgi:hypothetical protein
MEAESRSGLVHALAGAAALGAVSTFGDWIWARYLRDGDPVAGVVHGAVIFLVLAAVLSWSAGTRRAAARLLAALPALGMSLAAAFYPVAWVIGYLGALIVTWLAMWLALAFLQRWARDGQESFGRTVQRGGIAAVGSGLAFWAISGIWTSPSPDPSYLWRFACWTFAFLPGFLALLLLPGVRGSGRGGSEHFPALSDTSRQLPT